MIRHLTKEEARMEAHRRKMVMEEAERLEEEQRKRRRDEDSAMSVMADIAMGVAMNATFDSGPSMDTSSSSDFSGGGGDFGGGGASGDW